MADPRFSAPDLKPDQVKRARENGKKWPRNRDIDFNPAKNPSGSEEKS